MKGLVFRTFYEFCEANHGQEVLDEVIEAADLPNRGAYTTVGTYPFAHMEALLGAFLERTGKTQQGTLQEFGVFCFKKWVKIWPAEFDGKELFDVLSNVDEFHERQVRKLYPDAELPSFRVESRTATELVLGYRSSKPLSDLAAGVIRGAGQHLEHPVSLSQELAQDDVGDYVRITITSIK